MTDDLPGLTVLLRRWSHGDAAALEAITSLVYSQLRALAGGYLRRERAGHTLQPTELINEAYLRLMDQHQSFDSRRQFYGVAAHLMRIVLVDHARLHSAAKRGSGVPNLALEGIEAPEPLPQIDLLALDEALDRLAAIDERKSRAIELRYFAGMSAEEIGDFLGVSAVTIRRELRFAENWLCGQIQQSTR